MYSVLLELPQMSGASTENPSSDALFPRRFGRMGELGDFTHPMESGVSVYFGGRIRKARVQTEHSVKYPGHRGASAISSISGVPLVSAIVRGGPVSP